MALRHVRPWKFLGVLTSLDLSPAERILLTPVWWGACRKMGLLVQMVL